MNNYELTERGKIVIAVILVVILLVIPAIIILAMSSCSDSSPPDTGGSISETEDPTQTTQETSDLTSPSPSQGDGFDPTPNPTPDTSSDPTPDPTSIGGDNIIAESPPAHGPVVLNPELGTMELTFSLDADNELDSDIVEMFGDFLNSPRNTAGTIIKVEIPHLDAADEEILVGAVADAFSAFNITENNILYVKTDNHASARQIDVFLSYTSAPTSGVK